MAVISLILVGDFVIVAATGSVDVFGCNFDFAVGTVVTLRSMHMHVFVLCLIRVLPQRREVADLRKIFNPAIKGRPYPMVWLSHVNDYDYLPPRSFLLPPF